MQIHLFNLRIQILDETLPIQVPFWHVKLLVALIREPGRQPVGLNHTAARQITK